MADALSRATHLPYTDVILHDGDTLSAELPHEPYQPLALTSVLVCRALTQEQFPPLHTSSLSSHGPHPMSPGASPQGSRLIAPPGIRSTRSEAHSVQLRPAASRLAKSASSSGYQSSHPLQPAPSAQHDLLPSFFRDTIRPQPRLPGSPPLSPPALPPPPPRRFALVSTRDQDMLSAPLTPPGLPPPPPLPQQQPISGSKTSQQTSRATDQPPEDIILDQTVYEEMGANLKDQHNAHLSLNVVLADFWERVRVGYSHDPAFQSPNEEYRFDKHLQAYFLGHKLVVPDHDQLRKQILLWHHVHPWHAHLGVQRTAALITESFHWPRISADIRSFVSQCHSCQLMKSPGCSDSTLSPLPVPTACWRVISLDMITQLPRTSDGFDCIVVFVGQFS